jgi:hypothetical protein
MSYGPITARNGPLHGGLVGLGGATIAGEMVTDSKLW